MTIAKTGRSMKNRAIVADRQRPGAVGAAATCRRIELRHGDDGGFERCARARLLQAFDDDAIADREPFVDDPLVADAGPERHGPGFRHVAFPCGRDEIPPELLLDGAIGNENRRWRASRP